MITDYARQRVAESCAAQGIPVEPPGDLLEVVAAMLAGIEGGHDDAA